MKTSNSVLSAVVVTVLGLSAALSAQPVLEVYPGDTCVKLPGAANITRNLLGGIANDSETANLFVSCSIVNDVLLRLSAAFMTLTDRNPGPIVSDNILCNLFQVRHITQNSGVVLSVTSDSTTGASNNLTNVVFFPPFLDQNNPTGTNSTNYIRCLIPRRTSAGAVSEIHSYVVQESPTGMFQTMLPPEVEERQARTVVEAQEMRVNQALKTEKEDPEWSQRAETSWTQVFQKEDIKEELKGIQLSNIECRTTLCRVELTPIDPVQGSSAFGEDVSKLMLFAPWPVSGFGKIENPNGQAPVAVFYIAREGHSLP